MPTYEYECTACGQHIEVFQRISEDPLTTCGVCGGPLRKVFHPAGIVFKGSGFYATDSRSKAAAGSKRDAGGSKESGSDASGTSSNGDGSGGGSSGDSSGGSSGATSSGGSSTSASKETSSS